MEVDEAPDVYRGLARLTCGATPRQAAVVCVDYLLPDEFEFFTLIRRRRPSISVFAYADARLSAKLDRALSVDGVERFEPAALRRLAEAKRPRADDPAGGFGGAAASLLRPRAHEYRRREQDPPEARRGDGEPLESLDPDLDVSEDAGLELQDADETASLGPVVPLPPPAARQERVTGDRRRPGDEAAPGEPVDDVADVRVPWGSYGDRPTRTPPRQPPAGPVPPARRPQAPLEDTPLLTEEELQALIGDDDLDDPFDPPEGGRPS
ncbi:MAG: hypothetical protein C4547_09330 [Phycisphaerales bacterium]|nr:MAG: hypothetical protein C4547_09330 [Phycisphaerales bacterium]